MQGIAVVGSGISGLMTAWLLASRYQVTLFEAADRPGGHTNTEQIRLGTATYPVNTGFIVFNDRTYPNFQRLLRELGQVPAEKTDMSFGVRCEQSGLEYCGSSLNTLFAQRRNLARPGFLKMVREILRFNRVATAAAESGRIQPGLTLGEFLDQNGFSGWVVHKYIVPMGAAIWSAGETDMRRFQALFFIRFLRNHGLLSLWDRPQWYTLSGGSEAYIEPITRPYRQRLHCNTPVRSIVRLGDRVRLRTDTAEQDFDQVVLACHADQALQLLSDPSPAERDVLSALPYTENDVILHTDTGLLPTRKNAWAAWNYRIPENPQDPVTLTYNMNRLQNFHQAPETLCVSLNAADTVAPERILKRFRYAHPGFTPQGMTAQTRHADISNHNRTHFCGAYWFNGFHEDGVNSAIRVAADLGVQW